jgi:hypothetical protein
LKLTEWISRRHALRPVKPGYRRNLMWFYFASAAITLALSFIPGFIYLRVATGIFLVFALITRADWLNDRAIVRGRSGGRDSGSNR